MKRLFNVYINPSPHSDGLFLRKFPHVRTLHYITVGSIYSWWSFYCTNTIQFSFVIPAISKQSFVNACLFYLILIGNVQTTLHHLTVFDEVKRNKKNNKGPQYHQRVETRKREMFSQKSVRRFVGDSSAFVMGAMFLASALNISISSRY